MKKVIVIILSLLLFLLAGAVIGWRQGRAQLKADAAAVDLSHQLEVAALCADGLNLLAGEGDPGAAMRLLEARLASAIEQTDQLTQAGATITEPIPNLKEGMRRAWEYYRHRNPNAELAAKAEAVMCRLDEITASQSVPAAEEE